MTKLKNISGSELSFPTLGFTAPVGDFDAPAEIAARLLTNDAIQKAGKTDEVEMKVVDATAKVERKVKFKEKG